MKIKNKSKIEVFEKRNARGQARLAMDLKGLVLSVYDYTQNMFENKKNYGKY